MRIAVVIRGWSGEELSGGISDVTSVHSVLTDAEIGGCSPTESQVVLDPVGKAPFCERLETALSGWDPNNQLVLYYTGHGELYRGFYVLLMGPEERDRLPVSYFYDAMRLFGINKAVLILDSCYSGKAAAGVKAAARLAYKPPKDTTPNGVAILTSSSEIETSEELRDGSKSVFTKHLCDVLRDGLGNEYGNPQHIHIGPVHQEITRRIEAAGVAQTPMFALDRADGQIWLAKNRHPKPTTDSAQRPSLPAEALAFYDSTVDLDWTRWERQPCPDFAVGDLDERSLRSLYRARMGNSGREIDPEAIVADLGLRSGYQDHTGNRLLTMVAAVCLARQGKGPVERSSSQFIHVDDNGGRIYYTVVSGSIPQQVRSLMMRTSRRLSIESGIDKYGKRYDRKEIPREILREVICNAFAHRDWGQAQSVEVQVSPKSITIKSPGSLPAALGRINIMRATRVSVPVNPILSGMLRDLRLAERSGSGFHMLRQFALEHGAGAVKIASLPGPTIAVTISRPSSVPESAQWTTVLARHWGILAWVLPRSLRPAAEESLLHITEDIVGMERAGYSRLIVRIMFWVRTAWFFVCLVIDTPRRLIREVFKS